MQGASMTTASMSSMTPVKVRGKRGATKAEKWNAGKARQRRVSDDSWHSPSVASSPSVRDIQPSTRKRKRRAVELCRLEELPTEILQEIFEYSKNLNLPFASPELKSQLSDRHTYHELTTQMLEPILSQQTHAITHSDIAAASRLLSCNFMTWSFFRDWLDSAREKTSLKPFTGDGGEIVSHYQAIWRHLRPADSLFPPRKLLHGPWTQDRLNFLRVFTSSISALPEEIPVLGEVALEGLGQAISDRNVDAVQTLLLIGVKPTTDLLRQAVFDVDCNQNIVLHLMQAGRSFNTVDFLDPALWAWAERARAGGNEKGDWLVATLKDFGGVLNVARTKRRQ